MQIGRKDIVWNYAATFLKIGSSALLLPFILRMMPSETVGIWSVFMTITAFAGLLDFGFSPSFSRNVTYVFSGVHTLKVNGFETVPTENQVIDYNLLKGLVSSMRWFYLRMAIVLFILLASIGTYYIYSLLKDYNGSTQEVYIAWSLICIISTYNLFTLYFDSLLQGKGLVKKSKQIAIVGNITYILIAIIFITKGYGLIAIVSAQASSVIIIRWLSYNAFFTSDMKQKMHHATSCPNKEILKAIYPNALKIGLTSLGGFLVQKSALIIGSLYLSLSEIASYGITMQLIAVIAGLAGIYTSTYQPQISQLRIKQNTPVIKEIYLKGQLVLILTFITGGIALIGFGEWVLNLFGSQTMLLPTSIMIIALFLALLESNLSIAGSILVTKNEVPFFKASLISGLVIVMGLLIFFKYTSMGLIIMIIVPLIVDIAYQAWKWPLDVIKDLKITLLINPYRKV